MKAIIESIRGAKHLEILIIIVLVSVAGLMMFGGTNRPSTVKTEAETRLERLLERIDGVGDVDVMISTDENDKPIGVAVVANGILDVRAKLEIQSAIQALLDIDLQRIRVIGKGGLDE